MHGSNGTARRSVDWQILIVIGASIGIGQALQVTGAATALLIEEMLAVLDASENILDALVRGEDERVGARAEGFLQLLLAVAGNEQKGSHQAGRFFMNAWRLHSATSLPSCL